MCATGKDFWRCEEANRFALIYHKCKGNVLHAHIAYRLEVAANRPDRLKSMRWRANEI